jgi:hypothetical protein
MKETISGSQGTKLLMMRFFQYGSRANRPLIMCIAAHHWKLSCYYENPSTMVSEREAMTAQWQWYPVAPYTLLRVVWCSDRKV